MRRFIIYCLTAFTVGILCEVSDATSTPLKNGSAVVSTREIPYADNPAYISGNGTKLAKNTRIVIYQYGTTISRVRVTSGKLNGKFVYVRTIHLKSFCMRTT